MATWALRKDRGTAVQLPHYMEDLDEKSCNYRWCDLCRRKVPIGDDVCSKNEQDAIIVTKDRQAEHILNHGYHVEGCTDQTRDGGEERRRDDSTTRYVPLVLR